MRKGSFWFKIIFSTFFFILAIVIILFDWAKENITGMVITLFIIAFLPWIIKYVKSVDAFGVKVELVSEQQKKKIDEIIEPISKEEIDSILNGNKYKLNGNKYKKEKKIYQCNAINSILNSDDEISKLVLGRYEIEKIIRKLSEKNNLDISAKSTISLAKELYKNKYISSNEYESIEELMPILNKAIHSNLNDVDQSQIDWIIQKVIRIIEYLDYRHVIGKDYADWLRI